MKRHFIVYYDVYKAKILLNYPVHCRPSVPKTRWFLTYTSENHLKISIKSSEPWLEWKCRCVDKRK